MSFANASATSGDGSVVATHLANAKEHAVQMMAEPSGHLMGTLDTYVAIFKLATDVAASALSSAQGANADKMWASLFHTAASTKTVRVRKIDFFLSAPAASVASIDLRRLTATTAPATGNPAITPVAVNTSSAAAEAAALSLPTTAGSFTAGVSLFSQELNLGANTALTTTYPILPIALWPPTGMGQMTEDLGDLALRAGIAEGIAVTLRTVAAVTIKGIVRMVFTEE